MKGDAMNRLYIIRFLISHGFCVSTWYAWDEAVALKKISDNPEWIFTLVEDNDIHAIWEAR